MSVVITERKTKEERFQEWVQKALHYSRKEQSMDLIIKPGYFFTADLGVGVGSVISGIRPVCAITSTTYNMKAGTVTVIPCSNKEEAKPGQILLNKEIVVDGNVRGVMKPEMVMTISKGQIGEYIDRLTPKGMAVVGQKLEKFFVPLRRKNNPYHQVAHV